jgi:hypothetical protein
MLRPSTNRKLKAPVVSSRHLPTIHLSASTGVIPSPSRSRIRPNITSESLVPWIEPNLSSESALRSVTPSGPSKPRNSPLCENSQPDAEKGAVLLSSVAAPVVASRTAARKAPELMTPAMLANVRSLQIGLSRR